jgi:hypothetical protein
MRFLGSVCNGGESVSILDLFFMTCKIFDFRPRGTSLGRSHERNNGDRQGLSELGVSMCRAAKFARDPFKYRVCSSAH